VYISYFLNVGEMFWFFYGDVLTEQGLIYKPNQLSDV